jgi:ubiquinone/menaquinone biosynthesis C-methylase UbiE
MSFLPKCKNVLDIGCGQGEAQRMFRSYGIRYSGVNVGDDFKIARSLGRNVFECDFNFLPKFWDNTFDLVWARHTLEHSPFPLLTLMEFHRVAKRWLCIILPNPDYFGWVGKNHYSVLPRQQARWLMRRAGWKVMWTEYTEYEFRFVCQKEPRIGSEGWAVSPVPNKVYEDDRDGA